MKDTDNPWKIRRSEKKYSNPWIEVTEYQLDHRVAGDTLYGKVHFKNLAIAILPVDAEGYTWLVGQYRFTTDQYSWEVPAGGGALDVDPLESAKRELKEETGIEANRWEVVSRSHLSNSVTDEQSISYLARDLTQGDSCPEESEILNLKRVHLNEVFGMIKDGVITDALSILTLYGAREFLRK